MGVGLLGWSQQELADQARVGIVTVHQLEARISQPRRATLDVIKRAFEAAGVEFTNGDQPGVRLSKAVVSHLRGTQRAMKNRPQENSKTKSKRR
jgi:transcriptional regulator with XRE-family HTH domain